MLKRYRELRYEVPEKIKAAAALNVLKEDTAKPISSLSHFNAEREYEAAGKDQSRSCFNVSKRRYRKSLISSLSITFNPGTRIRSGCRKKSKPLLPFNVPKVMSPKPISNLSTPNSETEYEAAVEDQSRATAFNVSKRYRKAYLPEFYLLFEKPTSQNGQWTYSTLPRSW